MANSRSASVQMLGADGMTLIEYTGGNAGSTTWVAPATNATYLFGGNRRQGWVDDRDVEWFLARRENTKSLFRPAASEPVVSDEEHVEALENHLAEPVQSGDSSALDISEMTVAEVKALAGLTHEQWWQLHDQEAAGKNRVTVIAYIQEQLSA